MVKIKSQNNNLKNKRLGAIVIIVIIALLAGGFYFYKSQQDKSASPNDMGSLEEPINFSPPSEQEKSEGDRRKQEIEDQQNAANQTQSNAAKKQVTPIISSWGQNSSDKSAEVSGFLTEVYEEGGTCTLTMQKGSTKVTSSASKAFKDARTTNCGLLSIPRSKLSAGSWEATIEYSSPTAYGVSQKLTFEVQ